MTTTYIIHFPELFKCESQLKRKDFCDVLFSSTTVSIIVFTLLIISGVDGLFCFSHTFLSEGDESINQ